MGFCIGWNTELGWRGFNHFSYLAFDGALFRRAQGVDDADALIYLDRNGLLGYPAVSVLQDGQRGLGVARPSGVEQKLAAFHLAVCAALLFGYLGYMVKLFQSLVLHR